MKAYLELFERLEAFVDELLGVALELGRAQSFDDFGSLVGILQTTKTNATSFLPGRVVCNERFSPRESPGDVATKVMSGVALSLEAGVVGVHRRAEKRCGEMGAQLMHLRSICERVATEIDREPFAKQNKNCRNAHGNKG